MINFSLVFSKIGAINLRFVHRVSSKKAPRLGVIEMVKARRIFIAHYDIHGSLTNYWPSGSNKMETIIR